MTDDEPDTESITVVEPDRDAYTAWAAEYREELSRRCDEAGASNGFIRMINEPHDERHSLLMTLLRHHRTDDGFKEPNVEDIKRAKRMSGSFFTKLWDGDLADAWRIADSNNEELMKRVFEKYEVEATDQYDMDLDW